MDITTSMADNGTRCMMEGSIDEKGAAKLKSVIEALDLRNTKVVTLDFGKVTFIGSAGLGKLLLFYKKASATGTEIRIENCTREIGDLMKEVRLDTLFTIR